MPLTNPFNPFAGIDSLGMQYLNEVPEAAYGAWLEALAKSLRGPNATPGGSALERYLSYKQPEYYRQYSAANARQPNLTWTDFLKQLDPMATWSQLGPYERGENPRSWYGRTRWNLF